MYIFQSAVETLRKYAEFKGRASRHEFWCFVAFAVIVQAALGLMVGMFGLRAMSGLVGLLLLVPQIAVAVRRLHDIGKSGRELVVPCVMFALLPFAFYFRGVLPKIIALGFTLLAFANLLSFFLKKGTSVPNRYGAAPAAFSFAG